MSDLLHKSALSRFKECVSVSICDSLTYVKDQCVSTDEVVFKVAFTCACLKSWYDFKNNNALAISYVGILNVFFEEKYGLKVKPDTFIFTHVLKVMFPFVCTQYPTSKKTY